MKKYFVHISCLMLCMLVNPAFSETCQVKWRYKLVHTEQVDRLFVNKGNPGDSAASLENVLNRLGDKGWELASSNEVTMRKIQIDDNTPATWRVQFEPSAVLFKRRVEVCN